MSENALQWQPAAEFAEFAALYSSFQVYIMENHYLRIFQVTISRKTAKENEPTQQSEKWKWIISYKLHIKGKSHRERT